MAKVLLVTDYSGNLHITPIGNKTYYQGRNKVVKTRQFKFRELEEDEAKKFVEENKGRDPQHITVAKAQKTLAEKDSELANKDAEIERLKAELAAMQQGSLKLATGADDPKKDTALETIAKVNAAASVDEVNAFLEGETRKTVLDAISKKLADFTN